MALRRTVCALSLPTFNSHYINGEWVKSTAGKFLDVTDSTTGKVCAQVPDGTAQEMENAIAAARAGFDGWSQTPLPERKAAMVRVLEKWQKKKSKACEWLQKEIGCTEKFAKTVQAARVDMHWNTATPHAVISFAEAIHEANLPKGVFNMVIGTGAGVGEVLAKHEHVDLISFTGSTRAGRRITELGTNNLKVVRTELGGKGAALLLEDADLEELIPVFVQQMMRNTGQSCNALSRMLVPRARYEEACKIAKAAAEKIVVGRPNDNEAVIGPLVSHAQWERVQGYLHKGIEEGARVLIGGPGKPAGLEDGYYVKPSVFADVHNKMVVAQEEIFGPVLCLIPYTDEEEGIQIANDTLYGLHNAVGSANPRRAMATARKLRAGTVCVNGIDVTPDAPFGGYKQSGNAREWGLAGISEYLVTKTVGGKPP